MNVVRHYNCPFRKLSCQHPSGVVPFQIGSQVSSTTITATASNDIELFCRHTQKVLRKPDYLCKQILLMKMVPLHPESV